MTSGQRMVFAVAFDRALASGHTPVEAGYAARESVLAMREAAEGHGEGSEATEEVRAMLDDMLGTGSDR